MWHLPFDMTSLWAVSITFLVGMLLILQQFINRLISRATRNFAWTLWLLSMLICWNLTLGDVSTTPQQELRACCSTGQAVSDCILTEEQSDGGRSDESYNKEVGPTQNSSLCCECVVCTSLAEWLIFGREPGSVTRRGRGWGGGVSLTFGEKPQGVARGSQKPAPETFHLSWARRRRGRERPEREPDCMFRAVWLWCYHRPGIKAWNSSKCVKFCPLPISYPGIFSTSRSHWWDQSSRAHASWFIIGGIK